MSISKLLIANRGEIAIRVASAAAGLNIATVAVYSSDDSLSLHRRRADEACALPGEGVAAYLDQQALVAIARETGCDAVHPGYGFLAENGDFAELVTDSGLTFVGPPAELLRLFGDKALSRQVALSAGLPLLAGSDGPVSLEQAKAFHAALPEGSGIMIKAVAGGGGRGSRVVFEPSDLERAYTRCTSEAAAAFGKDAVYVEQLMPRARHLEVQILGDNLGNTLHAWERECSVQRRHQKLIEQAPASGIGDSLRADIIEAAVRLAAHVGYSSLGTFEFLVNMDSSEPGFAFIEANARLQVEHTVTEAVTGLDLVQTQLQLAAGTSLAELGLTTAPPLLGHALQARVNLETLQQDGSVRPAAGTISIYEPPGGPGVRVDGCGFSGFATNPHFDSLLAKVIVHSRGADPRLCVQSAIRALEEFRLEGVASNLALLKAILKQDDLVQGRVSTRWLDARLKELLASAAQEETYPGPVHPGNSTQETGFAGAQIQSNDPLALFDYDRSVKAQLETPVDRRVADAGPAGSSSLPAPIQGTIVAVEATEGDRVRAGQLLIVMEAMKMEHEVAAPFSGLVRHVNVAVGDVVAEGRPLVYLEQADLEDEEVAAGFSVDPDHIRDDLAESVQRHAFTLDENRPDAVARRRRTGQRTARENIEALCDPGSFKEYGPLVLAAQRRRHSLDYLRKNTPADGLIMGIGHVNGSAFIDTDSRCLVLSYDYTVLAGTQGQKNHYKQDRMFELAERFRLPVVFYTEGGGGRPGDTDSAGGIGMDVTTFTQWSRLSGLVPLVGVNSGRCFAGNTALLACCDVIIATRNSTIGMGGPAMIEGGGLGIFTPEEVGPMEVQVPNGVVDILVEDDAEATLIACKYLSYFQGSTSDWQAQDQRPLRHLVPEDRKRMYRVRDIIDRIADMDSVLEIRSEFGIGIITALIRIEGRPMGLIANNPHHLAGAIDSDGADKGARFLQLCDAFDLPLLSLMDCPGIMVGPEVEKTALVRHCCRLFNTGANLSVPMFGVILRKAYGLGVQAMCGGGSRVPFFVVAWPTAEFAGMNIEGSIKLGFRKELAAITDPEERLARYQEMVERAYDNAKAVNAASFYGVDDVIDPASTRQWIAEGLRALPPASPREGKKRPNIDTW